MNLNINANEINEFLVSCVISFLISLSSLIITFFIHKSFKNNKFFTKVINKNKYFDKIYDFLVGVILSSISFIFFKNEELNITIFSFAIISLSFFLGRYFFIGTLAILITNIILIYTKNVYNTTNLYFLTINMIVLFVNLFFMFILKFLPWRNNLIYVIVNFNIFLVSIVITFPLIFTNTIGSIITDEDKFFFLVSYVNYLLISLLSFALLKLFDKFIKNTKTLQEGLVMKNNFVLQKFAHQKINEFIKNNFIKRAIVTKINIYGLDNITSKMGASYASKIKNKALDLILEKTKKQKLISYLGPQNDYFMFIKMNDDQKIKLDEIIEGNNLIKRKKDDVLRNLEIILKEVSDELKKEDIFISLTSSCCFYGIESNDINFLTNNLSEINVLNIPSYKNSIIYLNKLDNSMKYQKSKNQILKDQTLFNPNSINIKLQKKKARKTNKNYYIINALCIDPFLSDKLDIWSSSDNILVSSTIMCHTSAKAIRSFIDQKHNIEINNVLLIDYPQYLLEQEEFNVLNLIANTSSYGMSNSQICLNIYFYNMNISRTFLDNLKLLNNYGLEFGFANIKHPDKEFKQIFKGLKIKYFNQNEI